MPDQRLHESNFMRVYFWTSQPIECKNRWTNLRRCLHRNGVMVVSNHDRHIHRSLEIQGGDTHDRQYFLSLFDAIVVDLSASHEDVGFLIAHASMLHLPILVLLGKNPHSQNVLDHLRSDAREDILTFDFQQDALEDTVQEFLERMSSSLEQQSAPTIKFTLRISPEMSDYLEWKVRESQQKKAEFLRDYLYEMLKKDVAYRRFRHLRRRSNTTPSGKTG